MVVLLIIVIFMCLGEEVNSGSFYSAILATLLKSRFWCEISHLGWRGSKYDSWLGLAYRQPVCSLWFNLKFLKLILPQNSLILEHFLRKCYHTLAGTTLQGSTILRSLVYTSSSFLLQSSNLKYPVTLAVWYISPALWLLSFSHSVMSRALQPHGLQHARLPCPSPSPGAWSNSCPLSRWCPPIISSSVIPFSSCLQTFPAPGSFQMIGLFT